MSQPLRQTGRRTTHHVRKLKSPEIFGHMLRLLPSEEVVVQLDFLANQFPRAQDFPRSLVTQNHRGRVLNRALSSEIDPVGCTLSMLLLWGPTLFQGELVLGNTALRNLANVKVRVTLPQVKTDRVDRVLTVPIFRLRLRNHKVIPTLTNLVKSLTNCACELLCRYRLDRLMLRRCCIVGLPGNRPNPIARLLS